MAHAHAHVAATWSASHERLVTWLSRRYPGQCRGRVEDAVGSAFLQALERPAAFERAWDRGGVAELVSFMHLVARRQLRQDCRKKAWRSEQPAGHELPDRPLHEDPEALTAVAELEIVLEGLVADAVARFGGREKEAFGLALADRLGSDAPDTRVAHAHGVPRESLCRARNWLQRELAAA